MKHKGIILLITLFFIAAISVIILKNLDDTGKFIDEVTFDTSMVQLKLTNSNIQNEITNIVTTNSENIDELLEITSLGIPLNYKDLSVNITLQEYFLPNCYLNDINTTEQLAQTCDNSVVENISYPYQFIEMLKQHKPIRDKSQIDFFIDKYSRATKDEAVLLVNENFGYIKADTNETKRYIKCDYELNLNDIKASNQFIIDINSKKIISFDFMLN